VFLECKDFEALIGHYDRDGAFFYLDPPYHSTKNAYHARFESTDHLRLRDKLKTVSGRWLLSYNDCPEILELYKDFHIIRVKRLNSIAQQFEAGCEYRELLIANYDIEECRKSKSGQIGISEFLERRETEEWIIEGGVTVSNREDDECQAAG
jgi:DNA adenine methylase